MLQAKYVALVSIFLLCQSCSATKYYFAPKERTEMTPVGVLGATFPVPPGQAASKVRILPLGVIEGKARPVLPVRFYLENNSPNPWKLDINRQKIRLPTGEELSAEQSQNHFEEKLSEVPKGVSRIWQINFPLPDRYRVSTDLKEIELSWEIGAEKVVSGTTSFSPSPLPDNEFLTNPSNGKKRGKK